MDFTFGVLTYNSAAFVVETLESIKFQIMSYANNRKCQLVVADDASRDMTVHYVKHWADCNKDIFDDIKILTSEKNKGTVKNYHDLLKMIDAPLFYAIAGDDLLATTNIFNIAEQLNDFDIITSYPMGLIGGQLFIDTHRLQRHIYRLNHRRYTKTELVENAMYEPFLHAPATLFAKQLYNIEEQNFVEENFILYEDEPRWIQLLQKTDKIKFILDPIVIYRYHEASVSHAKKPKPDFTKDTIKLLKYYITICNNKLLKCYLYLRLYETVNGFDRYRLTKIIRYMEYCKVCFINKITQSSKSYENCILNQLHDMQRYYSNISYKATEFVKSIEG